MILHKIVSSLLKTGGLSNNIYPVLCLICPKKMKKENISLDLSCFASNFDECATFWNNQGLLRDTQDWSKETHCLFIVYCTLYIIHSTLLLQAFSRYMRDYRFAQAVAVISNTSSLITRQTVCPQVTAWCRTAWNDECRRHLYYVWP